VAIEFASSAIAGFPPDNRLPMIPEPATAINRNAADQEFRSAAAPK